MGGDIKVRELMDKKLSTAQEGDLVALGTEEYEVSGEFLIVRRVVIHLTRHTIGDLVTKEAQLREQLAAVQLQIARHKDTDR